MIDQPYFGQLYAKCKSVRRNQSSIVVQQPGSKKIPKQLYFGI